MGGLVNFRRGEKLNEACNQKLSSLYESHKNELFSAPQKCTGKMHGPFLVCSQDEYWKSNIKISFVGQETRGWSCKGSVTEQMDKHKSVTVTHELVS